MIAAVDAFIAVSNATAAVVEKAPPYVGYRVRGTYHSKGDGTLDRQVVVRTNDGVAIVRDATSEKDTLRAPFPASPTFDALSTFTVHGAWTIGVGNASKMDFDMSVVNVHPLHYVVAESRADSVARSVKGYVISYAPDTTPELVHLHLERSATMHEERWLKDVWYDASSMIPTRIICGGSDDFQLNTRYEVMQNTWVLQSLSLSMTLHAPLWLGRATLTFSGDFSDYTFTSTAPDPRLVPSP